MIRYEFKKLYRSKFIITFFVIFLFADIYILYGREQTIISHMQNKEEYNSEREVYKRVMGEITSEKLDYLNEKMTTEVKYPGYPKYYYEDIKKRYGYKDRAETVYKMAYENAGAYELLGLNELSYKNRRIAEAFKGRRIDEYYNMDGIDEYLTNDYSTLMVCIIMLICAGALFYGDMESGMDRMVLTSRNGAGRVFINRFLVILLLSAVLMCVFRMAEFAAYYFLYSFDCLHMPLYSVPEYETTIFNGSIKQFFIIDMLLKCMGILFFSMIIVTFMNIFKKRAAAIAAFAVFFAGFIWMSAENACVYNPIKLFDGYSMFKSAEFVGISGVYLSECAFNVGVTAVIMALLPAAAGLRIWKHNAG